jgi:hypothetical protein
MSVDYVQPITLKGSSMLQLRDLATEPGSTGISPERLEQRRRIEAARDDGTERFFRRAVGGPDTYTETPDAITDDSPVAALCELGLSNRDLCQLERHDCETVADVREVLRTGDILMWRMCGPTMENHVRDAVAKIGCQRPRED